ncbi:MAG: efflux RND transporter periplasmic adaptor subunit [Hyphomicrobiales bacterium]|nr:efflux RND transporter periplasmic adaptor subunit [Hyphomicrobiales bacterium]
MRKSLLVEAALASVLLCLSPTVSVAAPKERQDHPEGADHKHGPAKPAPASPKHADNDDDKGHEERGDLAMTPTQIEAAQIEIGAAANGVVVQRLAAPGVVLVDQDRVARIPAKVVGTVAQLRKKLGDRIEKGEVVAVLDSREVADAKSEFLSASVAFDLQKTLFERTEALWGKKIATEQAYLQARATSVAAELRTGLARQKLVALGFDAVTISNLKPGATLDLRQYPIQSPIVGRVIERKVDVGAAVGGNNDPSELYTVADLSSLWVDLSVPMTDLNRVREGQSVTIAAPGGSEARGKIVFIGPVLNQETRAARVLASLPNPDLAWRPGAYVTAKIDVAQGAAAVIVPSSAIQTIEGKPSVFVRTDNGFERRSVTLGKGDGDRIEVTAGLSAGEPIAATNTFVLKAELGKSEASHDH